MKVESGYLTTLFFPSLQKWLNKSLLTWLIQLQNHLTNRVFTPPLPQDKTKTQSACDSLRAQMSLFLSLEVALWLASGIILAGVKSSY